jgi:lipid-binding SYLF domain-containing protein
MREVYGHVVPANQVLTGEVKVPASAHNFIAAVSQANMQAKASK